MSTKGEGQSSKSLNFGQRFKNYFEYRVQAQNEFQDSQKMHQYVIYNISKICDRHIFRFPAKLILISKNVKNQVKISNFSHRIVKIAVKV
jgi:hypothetical protein